MKTLDSQKVPFRGFRGCSIELLSPAKNLECGIAAVNHGADAVYIGAPMFSARANAGNSIEDIERLVKYAHRYRAKVFVALNTVLTDKELSEAEKLIHQIYNIEADALIVQDMGILELNLPPIALHASTQTDNRTVEKVRFLEKVGFSRVVLARELPLQEIKNIHSQTSVTLEAFVHGALCVSYSGQCYVSQAIVGRSANRGECAQFCRLPYDLLDADGNILLKNKHLLSLKDLNRSEFLENMIDAGVSSFKIEGRLKDADYVKNVTAFYRKKLDGILEQKPDFRKSSVGKTTFFFEPKLEKSFNRGSINYLTEAPQADIIQPDTPKSIGEKIGEISRISDFRFQISDCAPVRHCGLDPQSPDYEIASQARNDVAVVANGDGLCFINRQGELQGFRVNKVENGFVFPAEMPDLTVGTTIYRNFDFEFDKMLKQKTSERKISLDIVFSETENGFSIRLTDEENITADFEIKHEKQLAKNRETAFENIKTQLSKLGNTIYEARSVEIVTKEAYFFPNSLLNDWRRQTIKKLDEIRTKNYTREQRKPSEKTAHFPQKTLTYLGNVTNKRAEAFYKKHGVECIEKGFEQQTQTDVPLMFCKHCIKFTFGWCPKQGGKNAPKEPLFLKNKNRKFELIFDCGKCEMQIFLCLPENKHGQI